MATDMTCAPSMLVRCEKHNSKNLLEVSKIKNIQKSNFQVLTQNARQNIVKLNKFVTMTALGRAADKAFVSGLIKREINLYKIKHGYDMSIGQITQVVREVLTTAEEKNQDCHVDVLLGGFDKDKGNLL